MNVAMNLDTTAQLQQPRRETEGATFALTPQQATKENDGSPEIRLEIIPLTPSERRERGPDLLPDAWVIGVTQGPFTRDALQYINETMLANLRIGPGGAGFATIPRDGGPISAFLAQPLYSADCGNFKCSIGLVSTIRPEFESEDDDAAEDEPRNRTGWATEGGVGGTVTAQINGMSFLGFFNFRTNDGTTEAILEQLRRGEISELPPGTYSVNFGLAGSAIQPLAVGMRELGRMLSAAPKPALAAGGQALIGGAQLADLAIKFLDVKVGAGWRLVLEVKEDGEFVFKKGNQEVTFEQLVETLLSPRALIEVQTLENPDGDPAIADINDYIALINGADPFELARQRRGESGVPAVQLAHTVDFMIRSAGSTLYPFLSDESRQITAYGPQSIDDAAVFFQDIWHNPTMPQSLRNSIIERLGNAYGINFGIPELAVFNNNITPADDYEFIRSAFGLE